MFWQMSKTGFQECREKYGITKEDTHLILVTLILKNFASTNSKCWFMQNFIANGMAFILRRLFFIFLGALDAVKDTSTRPSNALIEVPLNEQNIQHALQHFTNTVREIEDCRQKDN